MADRVTTSCAFNAPKQAVSMIIIITKNFFIVVEGNSVLFIYLKGVLRRHLAEGRPGHGVLRVLLFQGVTHRDDRYCN